MSLSRRLRTLRTDAGITQTQLANLIGGVTFQAVSKWERDETKPTIDKINRLSEIFGVTSDYILKGK